MASPDICDDIDRLRSVERRDRCLAALASYPRLKALAEGHGLELHRLGTYHYAVERPGSWRIDAYPAKCRLAPADRRPAPPYLELPRDWTLEDVLAAAIAKMKGTA